MGDKPFFVVNPNAANGKLGRQWADIARAAERLLGPIASEATTAPGDASRIAAQAVGAGHRLIVSCGGDGTHNEVLNGLVDADAAIAPDLAMGILPFGTGGDLRRTIGTVGDLDAHLRRLESGRDWPVDFGRLDFLDHDGESRTRYFLNIASAGLSGLVDQVVNDTTKRLGGRVSFFLGTARAMRRYTYPEVEVRVDDGPSIRCPVTTVVVANGRYFGGGMHVAPEAVMDDGLFDVVLLHRTGLVNSALGLRDIYRGQHLSRPWVTYRRGSLVEMQGQGVLLDVDGEAPGKLPARFRLIERGISLRVDRGAHDTKAGV